MGRREEGGEERNEREKELRGEEGEISILSSSERQGHHYNY